VSESNESAAQHSAAAPAALVALAEFLDTRSMDDVRQVVGLTASGAVRLVDRLAADGYVARRAGTTGRSVSVVLTPKGRRAAARVRAARSAALRNVTAVLSDSERATLTRLHEKVLGAMTADRVAARLRGVEPAGGWMCRLCDFEACGRPRGACPVAGAAAAAVGEPRRSEP
jgi:DNA-binding MarR family transcriptional regulator